MASKDPGSPGNGKGNGSGSRTSRVRRLEELRQRAQCALFKHEAKLGPTVPEEVRRLLDNLRLYQAELEIQNEDLVRMQEQIELSRDRYLDLYDFAPAGYATLSEKGVILEANLRLAMMLSLERDKLRRAPLSQFVLAEDTPIYRAHFPGRAPVPAPFGSPPAGGAR